MMVIVTNKNYYMNEYLMKNLDILKKKRSDRIGIL